MADMSLKQKHMLESYCVHAVHAQGETKEDSKHSVSENTTNSDQPNSYLIIDKLIPGRETPIYKAHAELASDIFPLCEDCDKCTNSRHHHHYFGKDTYCFGCNNHPCYACTYAGICRIHRICDNCLYEAQDGEYDNCRGCSYCDGHRSDEPKFKCVLYNQSQADIAKMVHEFLDDN